MGVGTATTRALPLHLLGQNVPQQSWARKGLHFQPNCNREPKEEGLESCVCLCGCAMATKGSDPASPASAPPPPPKRRKIEPPRRYRFRPHSQILVARFLATCVATATCSQRPCPNELRCPSSFDGWIGEVPS